MVTRILLMDASSDFADEFPDAEVIGTDVSPIQPSWVPPNVQLYEARFFIMASSSMLTFRPPQPNR